MGDKNREEFEALKAEHEALKGVVAKIHDQLERRGWFVEDAGETPTDPAPAPEVTA